MTGNVDAVPTHRKDRSAPWAGDYAPGQDITWWHQVEYYDGDALRLGHNDDRTAWFLLWSYGDHNTDQLAFFGGDIRSARQAFVASMHWMDRERGQNRKRWTQGDGEGWIYPDADPTPPGHVDALAERVEAAAVDAVNTHALKGYGLGPYRKPVRGEFQDVNGANFHWTAGNLIWELLPLISAARFDPVGMLRNIADKYESARRSSVATVKPKEWLRRATENMETETTP